MEDRNIGLDYLKAIAIILMVPAHFGIIQSMSKDYIIFVMLAHIAPAIFMAVSGITGMYQIKNKNPNAIYCFYFIFFMVSSILVAPRLFEIISAGTVITIYLYTKIGKYLGYFFPIPFLIFKLIEIKGLLTIYFPHPTKLSRFLFPVDPIDFSLLPWLSFFLFGIFLHTHGTKIKYLILIFSGSITAYYFYMNKPFLKWMNSYYFVASIFVITLLYLITQYVSKYKSGILLNIGQHTLLFFVSQHIVMIFFSAESHPLIIWPLAYVFTIYSMILYQKINSAFLKQYATKISSWIVFLTVSFLGYYFFIPKDGNLILFNQAVSLLFALNYKYLYRLVIDKTAA